MKVLFATTNPAKVRKYSQELKDKGIDLVTLNDMGVNLSVDENGKDAIENAVIKARAYYEETGLITIAIDNSLFIEELSDEKQPGTHVRRVNGKRLSDSEAIEYYTNLTKEYGGRLTAKWIFGMALYNGEDVKTYSWSRGHFYFVDTVCDKINPGYPLDSISIVPECDNKYIVELDDNDRKKFEGEEPISNIVNFIVDNVKC